MTDSHDPKSSCPKCALLSQTITQVTQQRDRYALWLDDFKAQLTACQQARDEIREDRDQFRRAYETLADAVCESDGIERGSVEGHAGAAVPAKARPEQSDLPCGNGGIATTTVKPESSPARAYLDVADERLRAAFEAGWDAAMFRTAGQLIQKASPSKDEAWTAYRRTLDPTPGAQD